jgi:hypothetical protein
VIAELDALRATGAFDNLASLRNKYANPALNDLSDETRRTSIHEVAIAWESELDDFFVADK